MSIVQADSGVVLTEPFDSHTFVNDMLQQLADYGCKVETFLQVYASSFTYHTLATPIPVPQSVVLATMPWFQHTRACFDTGR